MLKNRKKKVIFVTSLLIIILVALFLLYQMTNQPKMDKLDTQYIATKNIDLPNGSVVTTEIASPQDTPHGWIGATLTELTPAIKESLQYPEQNGVYVQDIWRDAPAQTAGLLPGDIIIKINNIDSLAVETTLNLIASLQPGNSYMFTVFRQGAVLEYSVPVTDKLNT